MAPRQSGWGNARAVQQLGELSAQGGVGSAQPVPLLLQRLRVQESLLPPPKCKAHAWLLYTLSLKRLLQACSGRFLPFNITWCWRRPTNIASRRL
jgi:hypothetical protein